MSPEATTNTADRRRFLRAIGASLAAGCLTASAGHEAVLSAAQPAPSANRRPKVAAIFTEFRLRSHAWNILENCFQPYLFSGKLVDPGIEIASFYADQFPEGDAARAVAKRLGVPLFGSIDEALCLGGKSLAVDAVLSIGEHGNYPDNELGQKQYPRKEFFDQAIAVMERAGRYVPFFNDKHLSYRWDWAKEMYDTARRRGFPLMAGSSVPLAQRIPNFELPAGAQVEEAISIHGGGMEVYGFHGLEVLQAIVEGRAGGETGISHVELLAGDAYERALRAGRWSRELFEAAMQAESDSGVKRRPRVAPPLPPTPAQTAPYAIIVHYKDGLRATVLKQGHDSNRWNFACRLRGEARPRTFMHFSGPWGNRCLFRGLAHAIQRFFIEGREPYPVERTLLVTGALDAAMHSHAKGGQRLATPHLEFAYKTPDWRRFRETGKSWKILTAESVENEEFAPGDVARAAGG